MDYKEVLEGRLSDTFSSVPHVKAQKMFGGLAFMVSDKLCACVRKNGNLMIRCSPEQADELLQKKGASQAEMKGKPMKKGWLEVSQEGTETDKELHYWLNIALKYNKQIRE